MDFATNSPIRGDMYRLRERLTLSAVISLFVVALTPIQKSPTVGLAVTAFIMGGTNQVLSIGPATPGYIRAFVDEATRYYIEPTGFCPEGRAGCELTAVYTPEELRPFTGLTDMEFDTSVAAGVTNLNNCLRNKVCTVTTAPYTTTGVQTVEDSSYVIQGISQSAIIASFVKADLISRPTDDTISFVLVSNQGRPNGGLLERFVGAYIPYLGISFSGATPTNSSVQAPLLTVDSARQYDGWVDFPLNPLNLLAVLNAFLGAVFLHDDYLYADGPAMLQGYFEDTTYYLGPTTLLPLLIPLAQVPLIGKPLATALDPPLRVLVEAGYDRTINPGRPTPVQLTYFPNLIKTLVDFAVAIPTGWDDAIAYITGDGSRPFGTTPQTIYGVGGPPVYAGAVDPYREPVPHSATSRSESSTYAEVPNGDFTEHAEKSPGVKAGNHRREQIGPDRLRNRTTRATEPRRPSTGFVTAHDVSLASCSGARSRCSSHTEGRRARFGQSQR